MRRNFEDWLHDKSIHGCAFEEEFYKCGRVECGTIGWNAAMDTVDGLQIGSPPCLDDCVYRNGRSCVAGDSCIRKAEDLYKPRYVLPIKNVDTEAKM